MTHEPRDVGVEDRAERFDPAIEISLHQIRAADVNHGIPAVFEIVDPGVLEEPSHNRAHFDVLADAGNAGPKAADAARDGHDLYSPTRGPIEILDDAGV